MNSTTSSFSVSAEKVQDGSIGRAMFWTDREAQVPRAPGDRGPLSAEEQAALKTHSTATKAYSNAYAALCARQPK